MIHPIYLLGNPELRRETTTVAENSEALQDLISDMIETMHGASGIGLAAPQIGRNERIFVVDVSALEEDIVEKGLFMPPQPMAFINPQIISGSDETSTFEEGCLSIPDIHEDVDRPDSISIHYLNRSFEPQEETFAGILARVIQHEYDHLEGILFLDHITALRRRLLRRRLRDITDGVVETDYLVYAREKGALM